MGKFKAGDRVSDLRPYACGLGTKSGTIVGVDDHGRYVIDWDGTPYLKINWGDDQIRLISTPDEGPVRTVARREIVPGDYGRIKVGGNAGIVGNDAINVSIAPSGWNGMETTYLTADELRSAAMIFSQLAEALDSNEETK